MIMIVTSINSVTTTVHEDTVKNVLLTDVRYYLLIICQQVSHCSLQPSVVVPEESPRGQIYKSLSLDLKSLSSSHKSLNRTLISTENTIFV